MDLVKEVKVVATAKQRKKTSSHEIPVGWSNKPSYYFKIASFLLALALLLNAHSLSTGRLHMLTL